MSPEVSATTDPPEPCSLCHQLWASKYELLTLVKDLARPYSGRKRQLRRCPVCGTYFLYWTDYEYLVNGWTEDEEDLARLTETEAAEYLQNLQ